MLMKLMITAGVYVLNKLHDDDLACILIILKVWLTINEP